MPTSSALCTKYNSIQSLLLQSNIITFKHNLSFFLIFYYCKYPSIIVPHLNLIKINNNNNNKGSMPDPIKNVKKNMLKFHNFLEL